jgi:hypothetical protein
VLFEHVVDIGAKFTHSGVSFNDGVSVRDTTLVAPERGGPGMDRLAIGFGDPQQIADDDQGQPPCERHEVGRLLAC